MAAKLQRIAFCGSSPWPEPHLATQSSRCHFSRHSHITGGLSMLRISTGPSPKGSTSSRTSSTQDWALSHLHLSHYMFKIIYWRNLLVSYGTLTLDYVENACKIQEGRKDGSVCYPSRGPEFASQDPCQGGLQLPTAPPPGDLRLFWCLRGTHIGSTHAQEHTCKQIYTFKKMPRSGEEH